MRETSAFCGECGAAIAPGDDPTAESDADPSAVAGSESGPEETADEGTVSDEGDSSSVEDGPSPAEGESSSPQGETTSAGGGTLEGRFWINSFIGTTIGFAIAALLAAVFFPVYFLGIVGGAFLGGLFQSLGAGQGAKVGAMVGFLSTIPFVLLVVAVVVLGAGWLASVGVPAEAGGMGDFVVGFGMLGLLISVVAVVVNVFCGVFGGIMGGVVAEA